MNALNEVNKVIASVTYYPHRHTGLEEEEWLTAERMAVSNAVCWFQFPATGFSMSISGFPIQFIVPPVHCTRLT
jgi:hypothetical protein